MIQVRHYTRVSAMRNIIAEQRIIARDQNHVFVEKAQSKRLSPRDAEAHYGLDRGKGMACVEFEIDDSLLRWQNNPELKIDEWFIDGDVDLSNRNASGYVNF